MTLLGLLLDMLRMMLLISVTQPLARAESCRMPGAIESSYLRYPLMKQ